MRHLKTRGAPLLAVCAVAVFAIFASACTPSYNSAETQSVDATFQALTRQTASQTSCTTGTTITYDTRQLPANQPYHGEQAWNGECTVNGTTFFVTSTYVFWDAALDNIAYASVNVANISTGTQYGSYRFTKSGNTWTMTGRNCAPQEVC